VVLGGVDAERFSPAAGGVPDHSVVFVGRLLPHKGVNDLIDALDPGVRAEIIGPAPDPRYLDELKTRARGKQITFRMNCDDSEIIESYRRALCVVLPSVYRDMYGGETRVPELLGQTLLEGMACGAPALCTEVASLPEIVLDGATGLVVPPNAPDALRGAIRWFIDHAAESAAMGRRGRERVLAHFRWEQVVRRCLQVYNGALPA
jgi:glycosyltransferase involved in cell wall biosynthesis